MDLGCSLGKETTYSLVINEVAVKFKYKNITYEVDKSAFGETSPNDSAEFHFEQFQFLLESRDYTTLENRITNYLTFGGLKKL